MNLSFYRQGEVTLKSGLTIYTGEDALPYVDDKLLIVADGLGGTGAIRHSAIVEEMFDRETVSRALFKDVFEDLEDETFIDYVKNSFKELYLLKENYTSNIYALKKSSYFGSRILASVILYHAKHDDALSVEKILEELSGLDGQDREEYLKTLAGNVKTFIRSDMSKIAENANLICETDVKTRKFKLLATTMCATLFKENEDSVYAIYFMVGDSRPYVWSESDGLCQVIDDNDGNDGAMDGCISLSDDFSVVCKCFNFKKPCVLFNASDGCFDSGLFLSPMAFEKLLIDEMSASCSIEEAESKLIADFDTYGTHDDSSTLAMRILGFGSFEAFKEALERRSATIRAEYLDKMEDLLDTSYVDSFNKAESSLLAKMSALKKSIILDEGVRGYCAECITTGNYPEKFAAAERVAKGYAEKNAIADSEIAAKKEELKLHEAAIKNILEDNFVKLIEYMEISPEKIDTIAVNSIRGIEEKCDRAREEFKKDIKDCRDDFEEIKTEIVALLDSIISMEAPEEMSEAVTAFFSGAKRYKTVMKDIIELFEDLKNKKYGHLSSIKDYRNTYISKNKKLAKAYSDEIDGLCGEIVSGEKSISDMACLAKFESVIKDAAEKAAVLKTEIEALTEHKKGNVLSCAIDEMLALGMTVIYQLLYESDIIADEELKAAVKATHDDYCTAVSEIKAQFDQQTALFDRYNVNYKKYM